MVWIWWLLPSTTANQGRWWPGSRRCASANASAITSPAGRRTEANSVLPCACGPGCGAAPPPLPLRAGPNRAVMMSPAVRGAGGMSATAASSAVRLRTCAALRGYRATRTPPPAGAGRRGLRGGRAQRGGQDRERRPVGGQQQPGARLARLRQPRSIERVEIAGRGDRELFALPLAEPHRALRADLLGRLLEGTCGHCPGVAGDDPRRVRVLTPVQLRVLRVQVLLAPPAVGDPGRAHPPIDHHPGPLVPVLTARARIPARVRDIGPGLLPGRAQVQVRLRQQPHELQPIAHHPALQPPVVQRQRLWAPRPRDHRLRMPTYPREQRIFAVRRPGVPVALTRDTIVCNAGVHGHRLRSSRSKTPRTIEAVAFPRTHPGSPGKSIRPPLKPGNLAACTNTKSAMAVCVNMFRHSGSDPHARFQPESGTSDGAAPSVRWVRHLSGLVPERGRRARMRDLRRNGPCPECHGTGDTSTTHQHQRQRPRE